MRRLIATIAALFSLTSGCFAAFGIFQTSAAPGVQQIFYNIVTDGGAVCDGVTDIAPNFKAFNTWARANQGSSSQVVLTIPNGSTCFFGTSQSIPGTTLQNAWVAGINNLIVEGTGATLTSIGGAGFFLGGQGIVQIGLTSANGKSARIQTATAGTTQVTLTAASFSAGYINRFSAGKWILVAGLDTQGLWNSPYGFPPNAQFFEWRQITNVDGGTGVITLDRPLTNNYLDTWPNYNSGNNFEVDQGGPATIYALNDTWAATVEYRGLTINQSGQTYANIRNLTYRNVTWGGVNGGIPTQNETFTAINTDYSTVNMEVDKFIGTMTIEGGTNKRIDFQSSSVDLLVMRNAAVVEAMFGSPKRTEATDSSFGLLRPGAYAYGASTGAFICTRCAVTDFQTTGGILQNRPTDYSMSSGVISFANTNAGGPDPDQRVFVPEGNIYWSATGYLTTGLFQAQAITQDATNVYIQTNETGGFPTIGTNYPQFRTHPAPQWTCEDCTGDEDIVSTIIQRGATALAPLGQYAQRSYAPTSAQGNLGGINGNGKLVSLTIDVTQAYTGSGAATLNATGQFHNFNIDQATWTQYDWVPQINLKQAGTRVITPAGTTCDGVPGPCAGDGCLLPVSGCFTPPATVWINSGVGPYMGNTLIGGVNPQFTMTLRTDQGVVN